ncbi:hypothetical protein [Streptomyces sp. NPDC089795]|uniref:Imm32 family immunity protein n=1 Tax=Streptomyces sp. NPDC089795 TaxID=3155297 RepID=UPI003421C6EF
MDLSGGATERVALALALAAEKGRVRTTASAEPRFGGTEPASVDVVGTGGPAVRMRVDLEHRVLLVEGDGRGLSALADEVRSTAETNDGGHQHIEHHPGHHYLAAGSPAMVLNSPHGAMPTR